MSKITKIIRIDDVLIAVRTKELLNTNQKSHYLRKLLAVKVSCMQVPIESPLYNHFLLIRYLPVDLQNLKIPVLCTTIMNHCEIISKCRT